MQNKFEQVLPDALSRWQEALNPPQPMPRVAQVVRYAREHRSDPARLAQFVRDGMKRDGLPPEQFDKVLSEYVKDMEQGYREEMRKVRRTQPPQGGW